MSSKRKHIQRRRIAALGAAAIVVILVLIDVLSGGGLLAPPAASVIAPPTPGDPLPYVAAREQAFATRATEGNAHVLFALSPGGVLATAARVAQYRGLIDRAVRATNIPASTLEGLVFLESAGRPQVIAGNSAADAAGLTQILAQTGQGLLGMKINLPLSEKLTGRIAAAQTAGDGARVTRLEAQRARIDARFDPALELAATVRYLQIAEHDFGARVDLAVTAYHSGIGNLQAVLRDYDGGTPVPYTQLYFDIAPNRHPTASQLLYSLGDDSSLYYWRVLAAERIMALYRSNRSELSRITRLQTGYSSNALLFVPPGSARSFADPAALSAAFQSGALVPLPRNAAALHLAYDPSMGSFSKRLNAPQGLYRGLRPVARQMLIEIAAWVDRLSGSSAPLTVASTVMDRRYDSLTALPGDQPESTGYTFQIARRYASGAQAQAFQFVLDRLQSLNLIAWTRWIDTIEITVAPDAGRVLAHGV